MEKQRGFGGYTPLVLTDDEEWFNRSSLENPDVSLSDVDALMTLFGGSSAITDEKVDRSTALRIPAVWACVNKLADSISQLPLFVFRRDGDQQVRADSDPVSPLIRDVVNDDNLTSVQWRRELMLDLTLDGRSIWFIERNKANRPMNLWKLAVSRVRVVYVDGRRVYRVRPEKGPEITYASSEVLDFVYMPGPKPGSHLNPIEVHKDTIGLALAAMRYAGNHFSGGGIVPHVVKMPVTAPGQMSKAAQDVMEVLRRTRKDPKPFAPMPDTFSIESIGGDPERQQMTETRSFQNRDIYKIWRVPPAIVGDLSEGASFNNYEHQMLNYVQNTLAPLIEMIEQELSAKLFGRRSTSFVEFNLDGLLRGDTAARTALYQTLIPNGVMSAAEARGKENLPPDPEAEGLMVQGAMIPRKLAGIAFGNGSQPSDPANPPPQ